MKTFFSKNMLMMAVLASLSIFVSNTVFGAAKTAATEDDVNKIIVPLETTYNRVASGAKTPADTEEAVKKMIEDTKKALAALANVKTLAGDVKSLFDDAERYANDAGTYAATDLTGKYAGAPKVDEKPKKIDVKPPVALVAPISQEDRVTILNYLKVNFPGDFKTRADTFRANLGKVDQSALLAEAKAWKLTQGKVLPPVGPAKLALTADQINAILPKLSAEDRPKFRTALKAGTDPRDLSVGLSADGKAKVDSVLKGGK